MDRKLTETLKADDAGIARAAALLSAGGLVAFPTETVYGLGADARQDAAVAGIFAAKGRPRFNPLIVHVPNLTAAEALVTLDDPLKALAKAFWPGPLTLVAPSRGKVATLAQAGLDTLAIRVPAHPIAAALLSLTGPLAAPSANPSGRISPTKAAHVVAGLSGRIDAVLDGGACAVGLESTIIGASPDGPVLLRTGGTDIVAIERICGPLHAPSDKITAPGQLVSHYAPDATLRLDATLAEPSEFLIGFGPIDGDLSLSPDGDLIEAAARLFDILHQANASGRPIAVAPVPETGLGLAINDRLRRAAAPR